jgi:hypothetical protein
MLETIRFLCRGRGSNRMSLWAAADALGRRYDEAMAAAPEPPEEKPLPGAREILAMGDGAVAYIETTLANTADPDGIRHLFETDALRAVIAQRPPDDPAPLRRQIRNAYHALDYPPGLRPAYQHALDALGPEESVHGAASREKLDALRLDFEKVRNASGFDRVFATYRQASSNGLVPSDGADPAFATAFSDAAVRVLDAEAGRANAAANRAAEARSTTEDAGMQIEAAEAAIVDANARIREANEALETEEARQQAVIASYNEAVEQLNAAIEQANSAGRAGGEAAAAARANARQIERKLNATIVASEQEARAAGEAAEDAERRAATELSRARREEARAKEQAARENDAGEVGRKAETDLQQSEARFAALLGRLIAGLGFVGIHPDPSAIRDEDRDSIERVAAFAMLLESSEVQDATTTEALEQTRKTDDLRLRSLATLALGRRALDHTP